MRQQRPLPDQPSLTVGLERVFWSAMLKHCRNIAMTMAVCMCSSGPHSAAATNLKCNLKARFFLLQILLMPEKLSRDSSIVSAGAGRTMPESSQAMTLRSALGSSAQSSCINGREELQHGITTSCVTSTRVARKEKMCAKWSSLM